MKKSRASIDSGRTTWSIQRCTCGMVGRYSPSPRGRGKDYACFSCGGCCGGLIGISSLLYPHPSASEQYFVVPFLVVFSSRNGLPHCGHFSSIGLSQKTLSHFG